MDDGSCLFRWLHRFNGWSLCIGVPRQLEKPGIFTKRPGYDGCVTVSLGFVWFHVCVG